MRRFSHRHTLRHILRQCVGLWYLSLSPFISYDLRINRYVKQITLFRTMLFYFSGARATQNYTRIAE